MEDFAQAIQEKLPPFELHTCLIALYRSEVKRFNEQKWARPPKVKLAVAWVGGVIRKVDEEQSVYPDQMLFPDDLICKDRPYCHKLHADKPYRLHLSIGSAAFDGSGEVDFNLLLEEADRALYRQKAIKDRGVRRLRLAKSTKMD